MYHVRIVLKLLLLHFIIICVQSVSNTFYILIHVYFFIVLTFSITLFILFFIFVIILNLYIDLLSLIIAKTGICHVFLSPFYH